MKARLLWQIRDTHRRGVIEGVIWEVPEPIRPSEHRIKYRLVYLIAGERIVGYDNDRGKGDHKHIRGTEVPYSYRDVPTLIQDFLHDIEETEP